MRTRQLTAFLATSAAAALLAACGQGDGGTADASRGVRETKFPGQVTAGGGTSGEVMAQAAGAKAQTATGGKQAGQEGVRGQAPTGSVSGTPGIPEGSGGTPSGAEMGGTTSGAAATQVAPPPGGASPAVPKQEGK
ncbi:MAG TPA: hypothetical protein VIM12_13145 [Noviherbaspirillum sp.]|uniref:hypothetical protein n=1 Tax=Noviherbaspirillum sp. TaxID=1926288 RepID=UPI002F9233F0